MNWSCIFGHSGIDKGAERIDREGKLVFQYEQCVKCKSYRTTVIGYGGISVKKWQSEKVWEEERRKGREQQEKFDKSMKELEDMLKERDRKMKELGYNIPSEIEVDNKDFGKIAGEDLVKEAKRRNNEQMRSL